LVLSYDMTKASGASELRHELFSPLCLYTVRFLRNQRAWRSYFTPRYMYHFHIIYVGTSIKIIWNRYRDVKYERQAHKVLRNLALNEV
jgi:hypothetical protein